MELTPLASADASASVQDDSPSVPVTSERFQAVPYPLRRPLEDRGFEALTEVQRAVLEAELEGRDLQIFSQTGSGKTVALGFVLAHELEKEKLEGGPEALIIVPTRELAAQVCEELRWLLRDLPSMHVASVTGGHPLHLDRRTLQRGPRVLVGTPGRLLDHVTSGKLKLSDVRELVLDEADQMLDMGFREELEGILDATPEERRTHLVSATFPDAIRRLAERYQRDPFAIEGTRLGEANTDIEHTGHLVRQSDRYAALVNLLLLAHGERTLVFVERRSDAIEVAEKLERDGFAALPLSGELAQSQRERTLAAFRSGHAQVLVATDVAARGLDVPDVATVIHTSPPIDTQTYTHRSGRTGRAGKQGHSVILAPPSRRRRVLTLLEGAGVELNFTRIPSAAEIRTRLAERARAELEAEIDQALSKAPETSHLEHAERLLSDREAGPLVAALLARLEPETKIEPRELETLAPKGDRRRGDRPRREEDAHRPRQDRQEAARPYRPRGGNGPRPASSDGSVRFFLNRGANQGATPGRVLAVVCRRGQVSGADIGSIAIHPNASTFDVHAEVAERFETLARRRDSRDPGIIIRRDRGPMPRR